MNSRLSRRTFSAGIAAALCAANTESFAAPDPGRVAILDTPDNAAKVVSKLVEQNLKVIGRYYARKTQSSLPEKIMSADSNMIGKDREPTVLIANGLSIVSAYQYENISPSKFLSGLSDTGSAAKEVEADAKAALAQAQLVKQPEGSAIYFGVDFNLTEYKNDSHGVVRSKSGEKVKNTELIDAVLDYFRALQKTVGNHYALGVYGNGFVNRLLKKNDLVTYNWISASRAFEQTSDFYNDGSWHLFQNQVDRRWFESPGKCPSGSDVDTNVQNPAVKGIGAWGNGEVDGARTNGIFAQRRFAVRNTTVFRKSDGSGGRIGRVNCVFDDVNRHWTTSPEYTLLRNANARVLSNSGSWTGIDIDDDGALDGYVAAADLTADLTKMPAWDPPAPTS